MKTATVTWITYRNYGTVLQAYALQNSIASFGYQNEILSDEEILRVFRAEHPFTGKKPSPVDSVETKTAADRVFSLIRSPRKLQRSIQAHFHPKSFGKPYTAAQKAISDFVSQELLVRTDVAIENLARLNSEYDAFICGSDQIWSVFPMNFNPYYFLDFANKAKISYAPSLGTERLPPEILAGLQTLLRGFQALSVREQRSAEQLSSLLQRDVACVCDPTLLRDRQFWECFATPVPKKHKRYLLCYFLESRKWYYDYAEAVAKKHHLSILLLPNCWDHLGRAYVDTSTICPRTFVARFRDASYVLTDSYHGSIFSMLFEKDFQYLLRFRPDDKESQNIRVLSLFERLGILDKIVDESTAGRNIAPIDYSRVRQRIADFRTDSVTFLQNSLASIDHSL